MHARRAVLMTRIAAMKSKPNDEELLIAPLQSLHLDNAYRWCGLQGIGRLQRMSASSIVATLKAVTGEPCGASVGVEASHPKVLSLRIYSRRACLAETFKNGDGRLVATIGLAAGNLVLRTCSANYRALEAFPCSQRVAEIACSLIT